MAKPAWSTGGNVGQPNDFLGTTNVAPVVVKTSALERFRVDAGGNIGIGVQAPAQALHLGAGNGLRIDGGAGPADGNNYFSFGGNGVFGIDAPGQPNGRFVVTSAGQVGIGLSDPAYALHLAPSYGLRIEGGQYDPGGDRTRDTVDSTIFSFGEHGVFGVDAPGVPNGRFAILDSGNVGIGTSDPAATMHVVGDVTIDGAQTVSGPVTMAQDLTVNGDVLLPGADCAEHFDVLDGESLTPGSVVVIDENGSVRESRDAYDRKVAGVVSGGGEYRHALLLDSRPTRNHRIAVALVGKVYCKVDAKYSPVELGDLLTTSPTPGHAMKATDSEKAFGSVLGKALRPLARGTGSVPVLIALQ